jgi:hypothetical protein
MLRINGVLDSGIRRNDEGGINRSFHNQLILYQEIASLRSQ